jgi:hypothetical protein
MVVTSWQDILHCQKRRLGIVQWQQSYGGYFDDAANSIQQTSDGDYVVAGTSNSYNGDVGGNHGWGDYWILKIDSIGTIQWEKNFGGSYSDNACSIQQTAEGGYMVGGNSNSGDGDITRHHLGFDYWMVKLNNSGSIVWQRAYGGDGDDLVSCFHLTNDGGCFAVGKSNSEDGDIADFCTGYSSYNLYNTGNWVLKLATDITYTYEISDDSSFQIYPIPAQESLFISTLENIHLLKVYNTLGEVVLEKTNLSSEDKNIELSLASIPIGIYNIELISEYKVQRKMFIKK